ncbi:hypothetical protein ACRALDRAFT_211408 [Sodiomyces alcalophilus JCM 7366]|uniref:uncharacterized protein n=1 Tax=Sodiomyces alcalophilus JCM 7366 TaxID=591952 RepID=UPI0039B508DD
MTVEQEYELSAHGSRTKRRRKYGIVVKRRSGLGESRLDRDNETAAWGLGLEAWAFVRVFTWRREIPRPLLYHYISKQLTDILSCYPPRPLTRQPSVFMYVGTICIADGNNENPSRSIAIITNDALDIILEALSILTIKQASAFQHFLFIHSISNPHPDDAQTSPNATLRSISQRTQHPSLPRPLLVAGREPTLLHGLSIV